ncbi:MAG: oligopeptide:H+ symporter [Legionellales bacterium]|nr:oligopeptide:H+ symporter [Legionellales bacterium]
MEMTLENTTSSTKFGKPFWVVWAVELWERFGFYGVQAIITLFFVKSLGYTEAQSFYVFGSFSALAYGFVWLGGWIGDKYLGARRTLVIGAIVLMLSYVLLALSNSHTIFYALSGIIVGNSLFKANPSSIISKMFAKDARALDAAMTYYYMAVNVGSMISMSITPIVAENYGWSSAFWICAAGLFLGLGNFFVSYKALDPYNTEVENRPLNKFRLGVVIIGSIAAAVIIAPLLQFTNICNAIVYTVVTLAFLYYLKITFSMQGIVRKRMIVSFILMLQGILFYVLYNQMPTSLTFFALHNVNNQFFHWHIPAAEYQVLNPIIIVIMSPILAWWYQAQASTHVTKFCIGMTLCAGAFLVLAIPNIYSTTGLISPNWMVLTYFLQSTGELLISGLGLAMVAQLCPEYMSGFVMGMWWLTNMLAGPLGAWVGALTAPTDISAIPSALSSLHVYSHVFLEVGCVTAAVSLLMWMMRPTLNKLIN